SFPPSFKTMLYQLLSYHTGLHWASRSLRHFSKRIGRISPKQQTEGIAFAGMTFWKQFAIMELKRRLLNIQPGCGKGENSVLA
ncbi:hypothetical protein, partial [Anaerotruncus colihominis]